MKDDDAESGKASRVIGDFVIFCDGKGGSIRGILLQIYKKNTL